MTSKQSNRAAEQKLQKMERLLEEVERTLGDARELVKDAGHDTGHFAMAFERLCKLQRAIRDA